MTSSPDFFAKFLNISPSHAFLVFPNLLWGSAGNDPATNFSAARAHIDDVVGVSNPIKVMFDDDDSGAVVYKCLENQQECLNIKRMETDGKLVEDEYGSGLIKSDLSNRHFIKPIIQKWTQKRSHSIIIKYQTMIP